MFVHAALGYTIDSKRNVRVPNRSTCVALVAIGPSIGAFIFGTFKCLQMFVV